MYVLSGASFVKKSLRPLSRMISILILPALMTAEPALTAPLRINNADLAVILPAQRTLRIAASDFVAPLSEALLPRDLLKQVEDAYRDTPVGDALATENTYSDWTLVSVRIAPCSPLGVIPGNAAQVFCWPEVRLVWQPVLKDFRRYAVVLQSFADDRAIHALYDFNPSLALAPADASRAALLLSKIRKALMNNPTSPQSSLTEDEINEFIKLRDSASDALMAKALALRSGQFTDADYTSFGERPEFNNAQSAGDFITKLKAFLSASAPRSGLKEMTSFSLPEGREPPQADEWFFLQFLKEGQSMVQQNIKLHSAADGRVLFDFGPAPVGSQMRDDPLLHTALETMSTIDAAEIRKRVLLSPSEIGEKKNIISDRNITLVPNTSCASCHKFNNLRFDFHALSYLEDREISVSPRVKIDVSRDLEWLNQRASRK
jgi:hypothetical protein